VFRILGNDGKEYGPVSADQLNQWVREGRANAQTQVQREGSVGWTPLGSVEGFGHLFTIGSPAPGSYGAAPGPGSTPQVNPLAITGFILSLIALTVGLCCCYGLPFNVAGIVFSAIGLVQIKNHPERYSGRGLALAGLIIGIASILIGVVLLILGVALSWSDIQKEFQNL
jgi:hypothetical protein